MNSCAFYSVKGTIPIHIKSIYVKPIVNQSNDQEIVSLLDAKLNELLINENILEIKGYDSSDSKLEIKILEVTDLPFTISKGDQYEKVEEWKLSVKVHAVWSDFEKGNVIFDSIINEWGVYGSSLDIGSDGIDNDGDGLVDSDDSDEVGAPRESAKLIAVNKITERILTKMTSTW